MLKEHPIYKGYFINNNGQQVWSAKRKRDLIIRPDQHGYSRVWIAPAKNSPILVHHLVYETFVGPRKRGLQIEHLNGKKEDNSLGNLKQSTASENNLRKRINGTWQGGIANGNAKRTEEEIEHIRYELCPKHSDAEVARMLCGSDKRRGYIRFFRIKKIWLHL